MVKPLIVHPTTELNTGGDNAQTGWCDTWIPMAPNWGSAFWGSRWSLEVIFKDRYFGCGFFDYIPFYPHKLLFRICLDYFFQSKCKINFKKKRYTNTSSHDSCSGYHAIEHGRPLWSLGCLAVVTRPTGKMPGSSIQLLIAWRDRAVEKQFICTFIFYL